MNGWQRLWVVICVLLLLDITFTAIKKWSKENPEITMALDSGKCMQLLSYPNNMSVNTVLSSGDKECKELALYLVGKDNTRRFVTLDRTIRNLDDYRSSILKDNLLTSLMAFVAWLLFSAIIYFIGLIIAWVVKGFKKAPAPDT